MALSKEQILNSDDLPTRTVPVSQWGGDVVIKTLDGFDREKLEKLVRQFNASGLSGKQSVRAVAAVLSVVDDDGKLVFEEKDVPVLARKSGAALDVLFDEILDLNAMTKRAADELAGNSEETPPGDSGSS